MITIFTIPKSFTNPHINIIQRNAIKSWVLLQPACEIILVGNDDGVAEIAREFGVRQIPNVECNKFDTPLLNSAFDLVRKVSQNDILAYVNSDIILFDDFIDSLKYLPKKFLVVGQKWDLNITKFIDFNNSNWDKLLKEETKEKGKLQSPAGSDYFIFRKQSFENLPAFAVGRIGWDNWMIYEGRRQKMPVIDATQAIMAIHQNHDYSHQNDNGKNISTNSEAQKNIKLAKGRKHFFVLKHTNYELTFTGLIKKKFNLNLFKQYLQNTPEILPSHKFFWQFLYPILFVSNKFIKLIWKNHQKNMII